MSIYRMLGDPAYRDFRPADRCGLSEAIGDPGAIGSAKPISPFSLACGRSTGSAFRAAIASRSAAAQRPLARNLGLDPRTNARANTAGLLAIMMMLQASVGRRLNLVISLPDAFRVGCAADAAPPLFSQRVSAEAASSTTALVRRASRSSNRNAVPSNAQPGPDRRPVWH